MIDYTTNICTFQLIFVIFHALFFLFSGKIKFRHKKGSRDKATAPVLMGFTQCHACVVQTTTRYAGVHKKLYKKITNRITIRMFKSIVKKER